MSQALKGIRVIDMTHNQAGPACAQILGFLGADVIKLEEPKGGDVARTNMRDIKDSDSLFFLILNANKRSLTLNLKTEEGKDLFRKVIAESDVLLASASNAVIIGFSVKVENTAATIAKREGVQIKLYSIIYELIDQVKESMTGMLEPDLRESVIGHAEVKQVFDLTKGKVAGCLVTDGRISRTARARVLRKKQAVYDGGLSTLRRFQDDVKEVRVGLECGIKLGDYSDYLPEDIIECYTLEKVAQQL